MKLVPKQFSDLVTFTRASGGTSFRPVGYGPELIPPLTSSAGFTITGSSSVGGGVATIVDAGLVYTTIATVAGKKYSLQAFSVGTVDVFGIPGGDANVVSGQISRVFNATGTSVTLTLHKPFDSGTSTVSAFSLRELFLDRAGDPIQLFTSPINVPRIDYDPATGACKGLLIEEARTNLVTNSLLSGWSGPAVVTQNATASPDGGVNGVLVNNLTNGNKLTSCTVAIGTYTLSGYVKRGNSSTVAMEWNGVTSAGCWFNFDNLDKFNCSATSVGNGWYRIVASVVVPSAGTLNVFAYGNGGFTSAAGETYWWGAQLELGSFPTSYIPTTGAAATRAADFANINTLSPWFNRSEWTMYYEYSLLSPQANTGVLFFGKDDNNCVHLWQQSSTNAVVEVFNNSTVIGPSAFSNMAGAGLVNKVSIGVSSGAPPAAASLGVSAVPGGLSGSPEVTRLEPFANRWGALAALRASGHIRQIRYIPKRLTNAELQALTA